MNDTDPTDVVYAPYNFVPLARSVYSPNWAKNASQDRPFADGICGSIPLTIEAKTPLLVGGRRTRKDGAPTEVEFVARPSDANPFIPGSSQRGLIRAVVEIAGFGRMRYVDDRRFAFRDLSAAMSTKYADRMSGTERLPTDEGGLRDAYRPKVSAGWLRFEDTQWTITPCKFARIEQSSLGLRVAARTQTARKYKIFGFPGVSLEGQFEIQPCRAHPHSNKWLGYAKASRAKSGSTTARRGILVFTGQPNDKKHMEFVFHDPDKTNRLKVSEKVMSAFRTIHAADSSADDVDTWTFWTRHQTVNGIPVFYLQDPAGDVESLGLSMMYKLPYRASVHDLLRRHGSGGSQYGPHLDDRKPDLADTLFGYVRESKDGAEDAREAAALKGRVSFAHAHLKTLKRETPQPRAILSAPKPSYFPAYIVQPSADKIGKLLGKDYVSYEDDGTGDRGLAELRGWKRYPVRAEARTQQIPEPLAKKTAVQSVLRTLEAKSCFEGALRLHNVRPAELGALLFAIRLSTDWASHGPDRRHALGLGKPFGFGAVVFDLGVTADNWGKAELVTNKLDGVPPSPAECMQAFVEEMNAFCKAQTPDKSEWAATPQIKALLAMADPKRAERGTLEMTRSGEKVTTTGGRRGHGDGQEGASCQTVFYGPAHPLASMPLQDFAGRKKPPRALPAYDGQLLPRQPKVLPKGPPKPPQRPESGRGRIAAQAPPEPANRDRKGFRFLAGDVVLFNGDRCIVERDVTEQAYSINAKVGVREGREVFEVHARNLVAIQK